MQNKVISPNDLVCMNDHADSYHFIVDLAYARPDNLLFGEAIYRKDATLWLYKDLAEIVKRAALDCYKTHHLRFVLYDGLRTVDAQEAIMRTRRVQDNPHWLEEPRLLSPPGGGGHPRAMAMDIGLIREDGTLIDMGCPFDFLAEDSSPEHNPAHRLYAHGVEVQNNRSMLDSCMMRAADALGVGLLPLPEEWWDFRLPASFSSQFKPLLEADLAEDMRLLD